MVVKKKTCKKIVRAKKGKWSTGKCPKCGATGGFRLMPKEKKFKCLKCGRKTVSMP